MEDRDKKILEQLNQKKIEFEQALRRLMESQRESNDQLYGESIMDESDRAQREILAQSSYLLIEKKAKELKMLEELIQKISNNERWFECEECGDPIPPERIMIVPEARLCVACQRELERLGRMKNFPGRVLSRMDIATEEPAEEIDEIEDLIDDFDYSLSDSEVELLPLDEIEEDEAHDFQEQDH
jgi:DnaK suppressor protein